MLFGTLPFDPLLTATFVMSLLIELAFPVVLGVWLVRRFGVRWIVFIYGFIVFLLAQLVTRVPLVQVVQATFGKQLTATPASTLLWFAVLALTAGLFEKGGRWLGYRFFFNREPRSWANALMYGTGHEACESILLVGLSALASFVLYLLLVAAPGTAASLLGDQAETVRETFAGLPGWEPILGGLERIFAMAFQISAAVLVLQAFTRHNNAWLGLAILWHGITDFGTVLIRYLTTDLGSSSSLLITEGWVLFTALLSVGIILFLRPRQPDAEAPAPPLLSLAPAGDADPVPSGR